MTPSYEELKSELDEARQLIQAIRRGEVDTILGDGPKDGLLKLENYKLLEERNRLLEELQETNEKLKKAERLRDDFLRNMSHEMKSPLTDIIGFSELLLADPEFSKNEQWHEFLELINNAGFRFLKLVENLLELSRLMSGNYTYYKIPIKIHLIMESVISGLRPEAEKKGIKILYDKEFQEERILCDSKQMERVLRNILENAVACSENNSEIKISLRKEEGDITVCVRDSGKGIHAEDLGKIFSQYVHPKQTKSGYVQTPGLGLAIAKRVIEDHDGKIWAESEGIGKGALFCFKLTVADTQA